MGKRREDRKEIFSPFPYEVLGIFGLGAKAYIYLNLWNRNKASYRSIVF